MVHQMGGKDYPLATLTVQADLSIILDDFEERVLLLLPSKPWKSSYFPWCVRL